MAMESWRDALESQEQVREGGYSEGSVHRGEVGGRTYYVKENHEGSRVRDVLAYNIMDMMGISHPSGFLDTETGELVEETVGEEAIFLENYERSQDSGRSSPDMASFYNAFTAKYVMGDGDFTENMALLPDGTVMPFDFEIAGKPIEGGYDRRFIDHLRIRARKVGVDFSLETAYEYIEDKVEEVDMDELEQELESTLPEGLDESTRRDIEKVKSNLRHIKSGLLEERPEEHRERLKHRRQ